MGFETNVTLNSGSCSRWPAPSPRSWASSTSTGARARLRRSTSATRCKTVKALFASRWFAIGMAVALGAWLLHVAAMALAPLSVVQAVLSTGVVILAVLAERLFGFEVGRRQWIGVAMTAVGLILLVITLPAHSGAHSASRVAGMIALRGRHARDRRAADHAARGSALPTTTTA